MGKVRKKEDYIETEMGSPVDYINGRLKVFVILCILLWKWKAGPNGIQKAVREIEVKRGKRSGRVEWSGTLR